MAEVEQKKEDVDAAAAATAAAVAVEDGKSEQEEEFQADGERVQKAVDFILLQKEIGVWKIEKIIGAGANGIF